jgi:hypothetical protein
MKTNTILYIGEHGKNENRSMQLGILTEAYPGITNVFTESKKKEDGSRDKETLHSLIDMLNKNDKLVICSNSVLSKSKRSLNSIFKSLEKKGIQLDVIDRIDC